MADINDIARDLRNLSSGPVSVGDVDIFESGYNYYRVTLGLYGESYCSDIFQDTAEYRMDQIIRQAKDVLSSYGASGSISAHY